MRIWIGRSEGELMIKRKKERKKDRDHFSIGIDRVSTREKKRNVAQLT